MRDGLASISSPTCSSAAGSRRSSGPRSGGRVPAQPALTTPTAPAVPAGTRAARPSPRIVSPSTWSTTSSPSAGCEGRAADVLGAAVVGLHGFPRQAVVGEATVERAYGLEVDALGGTSTSLARGRAARPRSRRRARAWPSPRSRSWATTSALRAAHSARAARATVADERVRRHHRERQSVGQAEQEVLTNPMSW